MVPLMEAALERAHELAPGDPVAAGLASYLERHIPEEMHSDEPGGAVVDDLAALDLDPVEVGDQRHRNAAHAYGIGEHSDACVNYANRIRTRVGNVNMVAGKGEPTAFFVARLFFALSVAAVYQLARETLETRTQAVTAAILFGATPICFWFSPAAGTDIPTALLAVLGMW